MLEAFPDDYEEAAIAYADKITELIAKVETPVETSIDEPTELIDDTSDKETAVEEVLEETPVIEPVKKGKK